MGQDSSTAPTGATPSRRRHEVRWCRGRRIVVVDIENLVGGPCDTPDKVRWARRRLVAALRLATEDHVVVGVDVDGLLWVGTEWCGPRHVVGRGEDGADQALLGVLAEDVAERFDEVVVASGDGIFTDMVADLTRRGVLVTVVAHESALSRRLRLAAARVVLLSGSERAPQPRVPAPRSA